MIQYFGQDSALTYTYTGIMFSCLFFIVVLITWYCTRESKNMNPEEFERRNTGPSLGLLSHLKNMFVELMTTFKIKIFRQHLIIYISSFTALDIFIAVFVYFVVYGLNLDAANASAYLSIATSVSIPSTLLFMFMLDKLNVRPAYAMRISYLCILGVLGYLILMFIGHSAVSSWWLTTLIFVLLGFGRAGLYFIPGFVE